MTKQFFLGIETEPENTRFRHDLILDNLTFNDQGLIPAITQDHETGKVLMMAWMNQEALHCSIQSGYMTYWSRSRNTLWKKGETSGHRQQIQDMRIDCDGDALLFRVRQTGAACHTGRKHCFWLLREEQNPSFIISSS